MQLSFVISMLALLSSIHASSRCDTNDKSPKVSDVEDQAKILKSNGLNCCQNDGGKNGRGCTNTGTRGDSKTKLCGPVGKCVKCAAVGDAVYQLVKDCAQGVNGVPRVGTTRDVGNEGLEVYLTRG